MSHNKALVIFYPGCIEFEIMLACELTSKSLPVEVATPDGAPHQSATGMIYNAHTSYGNVQINRYRSVLIPGGDPYDVLENEEIDQLLRTAESSELLLGAICAGPLLLAKAGILKGHKFTHGYGEHHKDLLAEFWQGAEFTDQPVTIDDNIVTAKPEAHIDFAVTVARLVGAIDDNKAAYYKNYYKGLKGRHQLGALN